MPVTISSSSSLDPRGFFRRRLVEPVRALLLQGVSPEQVARTFAVGTACSLFPFLGATTALNLLVGLALRMNQPILQTLNLILGPLQVALILVYVRLGEWLWQSPGAGFTLTEMIGTFSEQPFTEFLRRFGLAGGHALSAWILTLPVIVLVVYGLVRPFTRKLQLVSTSGRETS